LQEEPLRNRDSKSLKRSMIGSKLSKNLASIQVYAYFQRELLPMAGIFYNLRRVHLSLIGLADQ
jgi:hypothetical protein